MKQQTEARLQGLEHLGAKDRSVVRMVAIDTDGSRRNLDGTPYVKEALPEGSRVYEFCAVDPAGQRVVVPIRKAMDKDPVSAAGGQHGLL